ncbi:MAG: hypothetical protein SFV21_16055 [Rhodospirillaceae bacterium]|nr:hypothetical protein [Rhodospirillaceae bacterium]
MTEWIRDFGLPLISVYGALLSSLLAGIKIWEIRKDSSNLFVHLIHMQLIETGSKKSCILLELTNLSSKTCFVSEVVLRESNTYEKNRFLSNWFAAKASSSAQRSDTLLSGIEYSGIKIEAGHKHIFAVDKSGAKRIKCGDTIIVYLSNRRIFSVRPNTLKSVREELSSIELETAYDANIAEKTGLLSKTS